MRQMVSIPSCQCGIVLVFEQRLHRGRFNMAIAKHHIGFALMPRHGPLCASEIIRCRPAPQLQRSIHHSAIPSEKRIPDGHHIARNDYLRFPHRRSRQTRGNPNIMSPQTKRICALCGAHPIRIVAVTIISVALPPIRRLMGRGTLPNAFRIGIAFCGKRPPRKLAVLQKSHPCPAMARINHQRIRAIFRDKPLQRDSQLPHIIDALDALPSRLGPRKSREQKPRDNRQNRQRHQKLHQSKPLPANASPLKGLLLFLKSC